MLQGISERMSSCTKELTLPAIVNKIFEPGSLNSYDHCSRLLIQVWQYLPFTCHHIYTPTQSSTTSIKQKPAHLHFTKENASQFIFIQVTEFCFCFASSNPCFSPQVIQIRHSSGVRKLSMALMRTWSGQNSLDWWVRYLLVLLRWLWLWWLLLLSSSSSSSSSLMLSSSSLSLLLLLEVPSSTIGGTTLKHPKPRKKYWKRCRPPCSLHPKHCLPCT